MDDAGTPPADPAPGAGRSALRVRFVGHATVLVEMEGFRVLTDPFFRSSLGPLERHGPLPDPRSLPPVDIVLVSHGHRDHFDPSSLAAAPGDPLVVVPRGLGPHVPPRCRPVEVVVGDVLRLGSVTVTAVAARHWITPGAPRAEPIGYLLECRSSRTYFAGDTGRHAAMALLRGRVDLALLPVWTWGPHLGPGHLGPRTAAEVLADLRARFAVPIHWGTLYPRQLHRVLGRSLAEPGHRFADQARRLAPGADVRVLRPGDSAAIRA